jgi:hypothetical protein
MMPSQLPPARIKWIVGPIRGVFGWQVLRGECEMRTFLFQYMAIRYAAAECNRELAEYGIRSTLLIQRKKTGEWREERTYGDDPPEILG